MKRKDKRTLSPQFYAGMVWLGACISLIQDAFGAERYAQFVKDYWVSAWITVPLALVAAIWALVVAVKEQGRC